jgi:hypothetical protein
VDYRDKLCKFGVVFVVRHPFAHAALQSFNGIEVWRLRWKEMKFDESVIICNTVLYDCGMMIFGMAQ